MTPDETRGTESWRPERETKSQRAWKPGQLKKQRSTRALFTMTMLYGEAFVIAFFGLMLFGLNQDDGGLWMLLGALVLAVIAGGTARFVTKPAGIAVGWILQLVLIASGFLHPFGFLVGIAFAAAWAYAVIRGGQIDEENRQRAKAQAAWEREHGTDHD